MQQFKDFIIKLKSPHPRGPKIKAKEILGKLIIVHGYAIKPSKFGTNKKCIHMQIEFENALRVVFTNGIFLVDAIQQIPKEGFPFSAIIIKKEGQYFFT